VTPNIEIIIQTFLTALVTVLVTRSTQQLIGYRTESRAWREELSKKVDLINEATQATMRTELIHLAEKFITRGWLTSEEYNAWIDMHEKYSGLGANGLIDSYHERLDALEMREV
jgi:hypothetical protein